MPAPKRPRLMFQDDAQLLQDTAARNALLDRVKQMGGRGTQVQADVQWGSVRKNGTYDLAAYDSLVNEARRRGLGVRFRLMGTPAYVHKSNPQAANELNADNPNAGLMGMFAKDMAQHFAHRVGGYSIWNEPNVGSFINQDTPKAAKTYRQLYQAGYKAIKQASPYAQVGFGEITAQSPGTTGSPSTLGFLRSVLNAGPSPLRADYFALHPYQWNDPSKNPGNPEYGGISNLDAVQKALHHEYAVRRLLTPRGNQVPLSLSEFGYKHDVQGDPKIRAQWMQKAYQLAKQAHATDFNMYQLMPRENAYWDSSIMNAQGQLDPAMAEALKRMRRGG